MEDRQRSDNTRINVFFFKKKKREKYKISKDVILKTLLILKWFESKDLKAMVFVKEKNV